MRILAVAARAAVLGEVELVARRGRLLRERLRGSRISFLPPPQNPETLGRTFFGSICFIGNGTTFLTTGVNPSGASSSFGFGPIPNTNFFGVATGVGAGSFFPSLPLTYPLPFPFAFLGVPVFPWYPITSFFASKIPSSSTVLRFSRFNSNARSL